MKPIDQIYTRINTPHGLRKIHVGDTPHFKFMKSLIHGGNFDEYKNYIKTYYPEDDFEKRLIRMKELVKNFDWNRAIVEINGDTLIDGTHRTSLAKALGYDYIQIKNESLRDKIKNILKLLGLLRVLHWYRFKKIQRKNKERHRQKQKVIMGYKNNIGTLVETGTYEGDMVKAMLNNFDQIYSVELSRGLYQKAKDKFPQAHVHLYQGDSAEILPLIIEQLKGPAIFWLDAHYSEGYTAKGRKETPVLEELNIIFKSPHAQVILIDDARCFDGTSDYPTLQEIKNLATSRKVEIEDDIIRIT